MEEELDRLPKLHSSAGFWHIKDLSSNYYVASVVVGLLTQTIQRRTGWNPALIGFVVSLCVATFGIAQISPLSWQDAIGEVSMRTIQLYLFVAGGVSATHAALRKYRPGLAINEAKREFWKPWF